MTDLFRTPHFTGEALESDEAAASEYTFLRTASVSPVTVGVAVTVPVPVAVAVAVAVAVGVAVGVGVGDAGAAARPDSCAIPVLNNSVLVPVMGSIV